MPSADIDIEHTDGVPWWEAPIPQRWHKCKAQTFGWAGLNYVERCACGAIGEGRHWQERNSRREDDKR